MTTARQSILDRIRRATEDVPVSAPEGTPTAAANAAADGVVAPAGEPAVRLLAERIAEYQATVIRVAGPDGIAAAIAATLTEHDARRVGVPPGLPAQWRAAAPLPVVDDPPLDPAAIDGLDGVLTACALAIAETGTIVLDGRPDQGRRALTLLPDLHVCVVLAQQVVASVPEAIRALEPGRRPITMISGPSATSDIELERVEGVHGPRRLVVVIAG
jgi:L-lactate dehydrogenase complex protein LldG